jgi:hypothetical protein
MRFGQTLFRSYWRGASPAWRLGAPIRVRRVAAALVVALVGGAVIVLIATSIPEGDLQGALDRTDFASKLLTALSLLVALTWALFKFVIFPGGLADEIGEKTYSNLQLDLECVSIPYRESLRVVTFNVTLANVGKVPIRAGKEGCRLSVWEVARTLNVAETVGVEGGNQPFISDRDLLARYDSSSPYVIGPSVIYRESESIVLPKETILAAKVTFYFGGLDEDAQTEHRFFRVQ